MAQSQNIPLSGPMVQETALEYARQLGILSLKRRTGGWNRSANDITSSSTLSAGKLSTFPPLTIDGWKQQIPSTIDGYKLDDIYNCDEMGLLEKIIMLRLLPWHIFIRKGAVLSSTQHKGCHAREIELVDIEFSS